MRYGAALLERVAGQREPLAAITGIEFQPARLMAALPVLRPLLLSAVRRGLDVQAIAAQYDVTTEMACFRVNRTGVRRQLRKGRQRRDTDA